MIKHRIHIGGVELDLAMPSPEIEQELNEHQAKCYLDLVKASYKELDDRTAEITFHRNLPSEYASGLGGNCLCYIDAAIVSGLTEDCFKLDLSGKQKPICGPLIPWGKAWYIPTAAFISFFRQFNETMVKEKLSRVRITVTTTEVTVVVKYPRAKGRYDDDLQDLTAEFGPLEKLRGGTLELSLKDLGEICERTQVKAKSYMGLRSYLLKTYEITLKIK